MTHPIATQDIQRIVIKIGTNTIMKDGGVHIATIRSIAEQVSRLKKTGKEILLVTSGAVGMGASIIKVTPNETKLRQAAAAVGQPLLMNTYRKYFTALNQPIAQILMTREHLHNAKRYRHLHNTLETLLAAKIIPICNENDSVAVEELDESFGDNDTLSALIASKIHAHLLIMLTDIDALYSSDPRTNSSSRPIRVVHAVDSHLLKKTSNVIAGFSKGGMRAKLQAIQIATEAGCHAVIAHGRSPQIIERVLQGESSGTFFPAAK